MNMTSRAFWSRNDESVIVRPETTSGRLKSGAGIPSSTIVESVLAMVFPPAVIVALGPSSSYGLRIEARDGGHEGDPRHPVDGDSGDHRQHAVDPPGGPRPRHRGGP